MLKKLGYIFNRKDKWKLAGLLFMIIIGSFLELTGVAAFMPFIKVITDVKVIKENPYLLYFYDLFHLTSPEQFLAVMAVAISLVYILKNGYMIVLQNCILKFAYVNRKNICVRLLTTYMEEPYTFHLSRNSAELQRSLQVDAYNFMLLVNNSLQLAAEAVVCLVLGIYLFDTSHSITGIVLLLIVLCMGTFLYISKKISHRIGKQNQVYQGKLFQWVNQSLGGIKEVKVLSREDYFINAYSENYEKLIKGAKNNELLSAVPKYIVEAVCMTGLLVAIIIKMFWGYKGNTVMDFIPQLAVLAVGAFRLLPSVGKINAFANNILYNLPSLELIYDDLKSIDHEHSEHIEHDDAGPATESVSPFTRSLGSSCDTVLLSPSDRAGVALDSSDASLELVKCSRTAPKVPGTQLPVSPADNEAKTAENLLPFFTMTAGGGTVSAPGPGEGRKGAEIVPTGPASGNNENPASALSAGSESDDALFTEDAKASLHNIEALIAEKGEEEEEEVSSLFPEEQEEYGDNVLDIDFAALAETTSGTKKDLDQYVASVVPSKKNRFTGLFEGKNLIFISAEAFSGDIIDPELTPTLYRLSTKGINFTDYYQPALAGTTGGEYENIFGLIPTDGGKSMKEITQHDTSITIASHLCALGYYGKAYHNNTYTIYGRNETHNKLGYSDGFTGMGNGLEEYVSYSGFPESDLEMLENTFPLYADRQPFCIYFMSVSGHGQYGQSINRMSAKNYDRAKDLPYSEIIKCYIANNLELEDGLTALVRLLEENGIADDTVIVIGADHFPYGLDNDAALGHMPYLSELYGYNVTNYLERDHNRLIIWSGCLEKEAPVVIDDPVFSLDILPTLCNLFGVEYDSRLLPGRDVFSDTPALIFNGSYDWKTSLGSYIAKTNTFTPSSPDAEIPEGYVDETKKTVRNKMSYCKGVLQSGYFDHVFGSR